MQVTSEQAPPPRVPVTGYDLAVLCLLLSLCRIYRLERQVSLGWFLPGDRREVAQEQCTNVKHGFTLP